MIDSVSHKVTYFLNVQGVLRGKVLGSEPMRKEFTFLGQAILKGAEENPNSCIHDAIMD